MRICLSVNTVRSSRQLTEPPPSMPFFSCFGRRSKRTTAAVPHFQITQIPEDGVNQLLQRKKKAESGEPEEAAPRALPQPATSTSSWKPYHNATVAVSSVLKRSNQPPIMPEEDFYHQQQQQQQQPAVVLEFLKEEQEMKRLIRTPTPDGLALIDDVKEEDKVAMLSGSSVQSLPPIPFVDDLELLDVLADPVLNEELDNLFAEEHQQAEVVEEMLLAEVTAEPIAEEPICIEDEITIAANEIANEVTEVEKNDSDLEMAMEALFLEEPQSASLFDSTMDSGDMTPNTLAMRLPMRCKTRVTEMATWFEKQMTTPEHNETFQQEEVIPLN